MSLSLQTHHVESTWCVCWDITTFLRKAGKWDQNIFQKSETFQMKLMTCSDVHLLVLTMEAVSRRETTSKTNRDAEISFNGESYKTRIFIQ